MVNVLSKFYTGLQFEIISLFKTQPACEKTQCNVGGNIWPLYKKATAIFADRTPCFEIGFSHRNC